MSESVEPTNAGAGVTVAEALFWLILCLLLWPIAVAYLAYRVARHGIQRGLRAVARAKADRSS